MLRTVQQHRCNPHQSHRQHVRRECLVRPHSDVANAVPMNGTQNARVETPCPESHSEISWPATNLSSTRTSAPQARCGAGCAMLRRIRIRAVALEQSLQLGEISRLDHVRIDRKSVCDWVSIVSSSSRVAASGLLFRNTDRTRWSCPSPDDSTCNNRESIEVDDRVVRKGGWPTKVFARRLRYSGDPSRNSGSFGGPLYPLVPT